MIVCLEEEGDVEEWMKVLTTVCNKADVVQDDKGKYRKSVNVQAGIQAVKEGYLEKLGRMGKWNLRWFELRDGVLNKVGRLTTFCGLSICCSV